MSIISFQKVTNHTLQHTFPNNFCLLRRKGRNKYGILFWDNTKKRETAVLLAFDISVGLFAAGTLPIKHIFQVIFFPEAN